MTQDQSEFAAAISSVEEIIEDARQGRMYILVDHEDRENEGDICIPAQMCTADVINFMATHGRGLICLTLTGERIDQLGLPMMAMKNSSRHETAFTVSIEAVEGVETGISAKDRALTVAVAIDKTKGKADLATPGHVFPLRARDGGVLVRAGHTEAAVDVSRLAGLDPSGVICEVMKDDGTMARLPDLIAFGQKHGLKIGTISDLIAYRRRHDNLIKERAAKRVTSVHGGEWLMRVFADTAQGDDHIVLSKGRTLEYREEPRDVFFRPSVDVFFESVAEHWPQPGTAVLLTGMGRDGARGMSKLRGCGWHTIAQDEATSVVWSMPKAAIDLGAAAEVLAIERMPSSIISRMQR